LERANSKNAADLEPFEQFCNAAILSALVCAKLGPNRRYPESEEERRKGPSPAANEFRRKLFAIARDMLLAQIGGKGPKVCVGKNDFIICTAKNNEYLCNF
jgi:hypothetical protein